MRSFKKNVWARSEMSPAREEQCCLSVTTAFLWYHLSTIPPPYQSRGRSGGPRHPKEGGNSGALEQAISIDTSAGGPSPAGVVHPSVACLVDFVILEQVSRLRCA